MAFQSFASERFWQLYSQLPADVQRLADQVGEVWAVRIGRFHPAIGYREGEVFRWGWIGSHEAYTKLLRRMK